MSDERCTECGRPPITHQEINGQTMCMDGVTRATFRAPALREATTPTDFYDEDAAMCECGHISRDHANGAFNYGCAHFTCPCEGFRERVPASAPAAEEREPMDEESLAFCATLLPRCYIPDIDKTPREREKDVAMLAMMFAPLYLEVLRLRADAATIATLRTSLDQVTRREAEAGAQAARVQQEDSMGCGVACLAMVTGQTYAAVRAGLPQSWLKNLDAVGGGTGLSEHGMRYWLNREGIFTRWSWMEGDNPRTAPTSGVAIMLAAHAVPGGVNHWVVLADGVVLDPIRDTPLAEYDFLQAIEVLPHSTTVAGLRAAINRACEIIEVADARNLANDGPAGGFPPQMSLPEWREMYVTLDASRAAHRALASGGTQT